MYGLSENGWITRELFDLWFCHYFLAYTPPVRLILLILDGYSSYYNPMTFHTAADGAILFCLPPHTTHLTQLLDKGCFSPLKAFWREECYRYRKENIGKVVTRFQFCQVYSRTWYHGKTMENVIAGFRCTGIYPFNPDALLLSTSLSSQLQDITSFVCGNGLKLVLLYTPLSSPMPKDTRSTFSEEQILLYQRRYEEGHDLPDRDYQRWLEMYHPAGDTYSTLVSTPHKEGTIRQFCG